MNDTNPTYKEFKATGDNSLTSYGIRQVGCTFKHDTYDLMTCEVKVICDVSVWHVVMPRRAQANANGGDEGGGGRLPFPHWMNDSAIHKVFPVFWDDLSLVEANVTFNGSGLAEIRASYIGIKGGNDTTIIKFQTKVKANTSPIETHPDFRKDIGGTPHKGVVTEGNTLLNGPKNGARFDPRTGEFLGFDAQSQAAITNSLVGVKNYYQPFPIVEGEFYVSKYSTKSEPHALLKYVGKASVDGDFAGYDLTTTKLATQFKGTTQIDGKTFKRSWMLLSCDFETVGDLWHIKYELELSGPRGWNPLIYHVSDANP